ncbi:MAG: MBOAT family protein [Firmicutes bacterium]|nr:MBOAT family protein [Bacillota bacterium]
MVFSSLLFLFCFFPAVLALYFACPRKWRNFILFAASLIFYAWGEPVYVVLMIFSTVVDYVLGAAVDKYKTAGNMKKAKGAVIASAIINLSLLGVFKYSDFLIGNINALLGISIPMPGLALPIGISFYTFQTMSYTIDIYRGEAQRQDNIIAFGTYVALFPQLIAGPIVRYQTVAEEMMGRKENVDDFASGIHRFMIGLGKKVLLANSIGLVWEQVCAMGIDTLPMLSAWIGIIAFSFQIYFDFSGYSDMAIGLGRMFGFHFLENFEYPYMSRSITEFWRRWHISLGTWFREYVYIPLGGNRKGKNRQILNLAIVWLLTGIWHGASWNFMLWGCYFGIILIVEKLFLLKAMKKWPVVLQHLYAIFLIVVGWALFSLTDLGQVGSLMAAMFGLNGAGFATGESWYLLTSNLVLLVILVLASTDWPKKLAVKVQTMLQNQPVIKTVVSNVFLVIVFILALAYLVNGAYNPFLYFRF